MILIFTHDYCYASIYIMIFLLYILFQDKLGILELMSEKEFVYWVEK